MRVWHDDVRPAPEGWEWARTNDRAIELLSTGQVTEISLDHDLGLHEVEIPDDPNELAVVMSLHLENGGDGETGMDLVNWMCTNNVLPETISVHSLNVDRGKEMAFRLADAGCVVRVAPFRSKVAYLVGRR